MLRLWWFNIDKKKTCTRKVAFNIDWYRLGWKNSRYCWERLDFLFLTHLDNRWFELFFLRNLREDLDTDWL